MPGNTNSGFRNFMHNHTAPAIPGLLLIIHRLTEGMNASKGVCRTALAIPGQSSITDITPLQENFADLALKLGTLAARIHD